MDIFFGYSYGWGVGILTIIQTGQIYFDLLGYTVLGLENPNFFQYFIYFILFELRQRISCLPCGKVLKIILIKNDPSEAQCETIATIELNISITICRVTQFKLYSNVHLAIVGERTNRLLI